MYMYVYSCKSFCVHINNRNQSSENPKMRFCLWILGLFHSHWHRISIESDWNMSFLTYYSSEYMKMQIKEREMRSKREEKKVSSYNRKMSENVCVCSVLFFDNGKMYNLIVRPHNGIYIYFFSMINQFQEWYKRKKKKVLLWIVWQRFRNKSSTNWNECLDLE